MPRRRPRPFYEDRHVALYHGDFRRLCPELSDLLATVTHVITDPPYSAHVQSNSRAGIDPNAASGEKTSKGRTMKFSPMSKRLMRDTTDLITAINPPGWVVLFSDDQINMQWRRSMEKSSDGAIQHVRQGLWIKPRGTPQFTGDRPAFWHEILEVFHREGKKTWNGGGRPALYRHMPVSEPSHNASKPLGLMKKILIDFTSEGDVILDLYAGLGKTLQAAKELGGRRVIAFEKSKACCEIARSRLTQEMLPFDDLFAPGETAFDGLSVIRDDKATIYERNGLRGMVSGTLLLGESPQAGAHKTAKYLNSVFGPIGIDAFQDEILSHRHQVCCWRFRLEQKSSEALPEERLRLIDEVAYGYLRSQDVVPCTGSELELLKLRSPRAHGSLAL